MKLRSLVVVSATTGAVLALVSAGLYVAAYRAAGGWDTAASTSPPNYHAPIVRWLWTGFVLVALALLAGLATVRARVAVTIAAISTAAMASAIWITPVRFGSIAIPHPGHHHNFLLAAVLAGTAGVGMLVVPATYRRARAL